MQDRRKYIINYIIIILYNVSYMIIQKKKKEKSSRGVWKVTQTNSLFIKLKQNLKVCWTLRAT